MTEDPENLNIVTRYEYDANDNMQHQYGPSGEHTEYTHDVLNRLKTRIQHHGEGEGLVFTFNEYDGEGNILKTTDAKNQEITHEYDDLGRETLTTYTAAQASPYMTLSTVKTDYDFSGNVAKVTETKTDNTDSGNDFTDVTSFEYDDFDRVLHTNQRGTDISYTYDNNGNRTGITTGTDNTVYTYDARNRLKTTVVNGEITTWSYTPDGKTDTVSLPNGTVTTWTWFDTNRVESVTHTSSGTVISSFAYEYDPDGNRTLQTAVQDGVTRTTSYTYDTAGRMTGYTETGGTNTRTAAYTFEGYNRKTEIITENGIATASRTYTYDDINRLTNVVDTNHYLYL